jgi:hypothetical protein
MFNVCPARNRRGSMVGFAACNRCKLTPYRRATPAIVSPDRTRYVRVRAGGCALDCVAAAARCCIRGNVFVCGAGKGVTLGAAFVANARGGAATFVPGRIAC